MSRFESDFLGQLEIPDDCYYGVQTLRGKENFHITEMSNNMEPFFLIAYAYVKKAAALTNKELGTIPADVADALVWACDELIAGKYQDQFVTDWLQGGAGTSTNMNVNEVICNLACEKLGTVKGDSKRVSPNDHANFGQSTNDTYPTALHLMFLLRSNVLLKAVEDLVNAFFKKSEEFKGVLKMGRTHLQDAVPMTLGQEFHGWGFTIQDELKVIREAQEHLKTINLGATAIGTCVTSHPDYPAKASAKLAELTGIDFKNSEDLIACTSDCGSYVALSSAMKSLAVKLTKVCNDIRLLASQASFLAIGLDTTVMLAASAGQLELNVMEPVITFALFMQMRVLTNACNALRTKCIDGITANAERTAQMVMNSCGIVTLLKPHLGYKGCSEMAHECYHTGKALHQVVVEERKLLTQEEWDATFNLQNLIAPKFVQ